MARDGLMPHVVAHVAPHARTPNVAILTLASIGAIFAVLGSYDRLTNMSSFGYLLFYALNALGYLVARNRLPEAHGRRALPLWIPTVFLVSTFILVVTVIAGGMTEVAASLILMALGVPAFLIFRLRRRP